MTDPDQPGVHHGVHRRLQEEEPRVLPGPDVDQGDPGRDAGRAQPVEGGRHQAGHVGAVPVLVHVRRVVARLVRLVLAGAVDQRDVGGEVPAQPPVEVGPDVRVRSVNASVHDPDHDPTAALVDPVGAARGGVDHPHVPLLVGQGLLAGSMPCPGGRALGRGALGGGQPLHVVLGCGAARELAHGPVAGRPDQGGLAPCGSDEGRVAGLDGGHADPGVLFQDGAAGGLDGGPGGGRGGAVGVGDDVLAVGALELAGRLRLGDPFGVDAELGPGVLGQARSSPVRSATTPPDGDVDLVPVNANGCGRRAGCQARRPAAGESAASRGSVEEGKSLPEAADLTEIADEQGELVHGVADAADHHLPTGVAPAAGPTGDRKHTGRLVEGKTLDGQLVAAKTCGDHALEGWERNPPVHGGYTRSRQVEDCSGHQRSAEELRNSR
jgi:hypothetical protein